MDTVQQAEQVPQQIPGHLPETGQQSSQVFVDASGRRARRVTRCGYLLGLGCVGYIGMVAMGLSGTRVAALPGVPTSSEDQIIAGLSGEAGSIGLHLTRTPVAARPARTTTTRTTDARAVEARAAALRSAAARSAALNAHAALARPRSSLLGPGMATGNLAQQPGAYPQSPGTEQVLAENGTGTDPAETTDPTETKSQEKAEEKAAKKTDSKQGKSDSKKSGDGTSGDKSGSDKADDKSAEY